MTTAELADHIAALVNGGNSLQAAIRMLESLGTSDALLTAAQAEYELRIGRIRSMTIPPSLIGPNIASPWYAGPAKEDRFWPHVQSVLRGEGWEDDALADLDNASSKIVGYLAPPHADHYSYRGLVLGYVQSGKTSNFTAVIAKAADSGYRFFIVLSGIHNALRRQTQVRLERHLIETFANEWYKATTLDRDFGSQSNAAYALSQPSRRALAVVKKNPSRLRALRDWLRAATPAVVGTCPVLLIDDEADQASVDSSPAASERRSKINELIIDIIKLLPRGCYVGYTATPFANLFINPAFEHDLYPRDFIVDLPKPQGHYGTEIIFGREPNEPDDPGSDGLNVIRDVPDVEAQELRPPTNRLARLAFDPTLVPSLERALRYFLLATACRRARGQTGHSTMLIHTTMYTSVHELFRPIISDALRRYRDHTRDPVWCGELKEQWEEEQRLLPSEVCGQEPVGFEAIQTQLDNVLDDVSVVVDNAASLDRLTYENDPKTVVVIGGNTLSRGLTLEGLVVSFFLRTANAYDTLLQMGRWFGYRPGYEDLPRMFMTDELRESFVWLANVEFEMRKDVQRFELEGITPLDFAVRIRTHPKLAITSALKMQHAVDATMSYEGRRLQTIIFNHKDRSWLDANLAAGRRLVRRILPRTAVEVDHGRWIFKSVSTEEVITFLREYSFHENSRDLQTQLLIDYIHKEAARGAITRWNVAIMGVEQSDHVPVNLGLPKGVLPVNRASLRVSPGMPANIKALMSKVDRCIDLGYPTAQLASQTDDALAALRDREAGTTPLLLLYPIAKASIPLRHPGETPRVPLEAVEDVLGVGLVFPGDKNAAVIQYKSADLSGVPREDPDDEFPD